MALVQSLADAVGSVSGLVTKILSRIWGDQTSKDAHTERAGEQALERAQNAQSADELNAADTDLQRVYDRARASHKPE